MKLTGIGAAPGIAVAPIWRYRNAPIEASQSARQPASLTIAAAAERAADDLLALADRMRAAGQPHEAEIFDAQAMMATDPMLVEEADRRAAAVGGSSAEALAAAVEAAGASVAEVLAALGDEVLSARAADVGDVAARIGRILTGRELVFPDRPSIAVADDLPPSVTAELPAGSLLGIALEAGTRTSHAAILARMLGIPAVVGIAGLLRSVDAASVAATGDAGTGDAGTGDAASVAATGAQPDEPASGRNGESPDGRAHVIVAAIDGEAGELILGPDQREIAELHDRERAAAGKAEVARRLRGRPGETADGRHVPLVANIGRPDASARALDAGAEGVGLFRTEFLFMGRNEAPTEAEQVAAYSHVLAAFGPEHPVVIRLADIGGDKAIPYLALPAEENPFLGVRGLRLAYGAARELLVTQIRAIARAGAEAGVTPHMMAPMVATLEDVELLHALRAEAEATLDRAGTARAPRIVTGIMVEVPSAALMAPLLATRVDFFSIGSNDLTQYVLAADRTNGQLGALQDALHPAVLHAIAATVDGADRVGIPVAVCGELASDPAGALVLVGLGVDELSMDPGSLDAVRLALSRVASADLEQLGRAALAAPSASAVRELAAPFLIDRAGFDVQRTPS